MKINISNKTKNELWWLLISVDYDYSRVVIADHEINNDFLSLYLEDKEDFKNTIDECLLLQVKIKELAKFIKQEGFNSYEKSDTKTRVEISEAIYWYNQDASITECAWVREALVKNIITNLVESEVSNA